MFEIQTHSMPDNNWHRSIFGKNSWENQQGSYENLHYVRHLEVIWPWGSASFSNQFLACKCAHKATLLDKVFKIGHKKIWLQTLDKNVRCCCYLLCILMISPLSGTMWFVTWPMSNKSSTNMACGKRACKKCKRWFFFAQNVSVSVCDNRLK